MFLSKAQSRHRNKRKNQRKLPWPSPLTSATRSQKIANAITKVYYRYIASCAWQPEMATLSGHLDVGDDGALLDILVLDQCLDQLDHIVPESWPVLGTEVFKSRGNIALNSNAVNHDL